ncbi:hypothetical protein EPI10_023524 [Gossypium australe]|uniref:Uncharacterized protein n=1 Tax=Gossypium australe TaxID=47621 RepID=A0A5B6VUH3_9ROSI|nr:hypothetical protein EPI10_023524 [Gossypium australe]
MVPAWTFPRAGASLGRFCWSFAMARTSSESEICDCEENPAPAIGELAWFEEEVLLLVRRDYARIAPEMQ